jgi:mannosyltransferase OCH1-like enzyme
MVFYFLIILIIVILIYLMCYPTTVEPFTDSTIPLKIFQTWNTKLLPIHMKKNWQLLKKQNPQFEFFLFDDEIFY